MSKNTLINLNFPKKYNDLKDDIKHKRVVLYVNCLFFASMQYAIPVTSGIFTAVVGSGLIGEPSSQSVILGGIIITVLGTVNSVISPAESYAWAAYFLNRFVEFENQLDLEMIELQKTAEGDELKFINSLKEKNKELAQLIHQSNQGRTIPRENPQTSKDSLTNHNS